MATSLDMQRQVTPCKKHGQETPAGIGTTMSRLMQFHERADYLNGCSWTLLGMLSSETAAWICTESSLYKACSACIPHQQGTIKWGNFGQWGNFGHYKTFILSNIFCHLKNNLVMNMEVKGYLQSVFVSKGVSLDWTQ